MLSCIFLLLDSIFLLSLDSGLILHLADTFLLLLILVFRLCALAIGVLESMLVLLLPGRIFGATEYKSSVGYEA